MRNIARYFVVMAFVAASVFLLAACGGDSNNAVTPETRSYLGTQNPGDVWAWTFVDTTFSASNETTGYTYSGTYEMLPSGFKKLNITATTDPGTTPPAYGYAIEVPNTAILIKPVGEEADAIGGAALGACPTSSGTYNWVMLVNSDWDSATDIAMGITDATVTGSTFDFSITFKKLDGTDIGTEIDTGFVCSGGMMTKSGSSTTIAAAPAGMIVGDNGPGGGGFIGMRAPSADINLSDVTASGRQYRGILIRDGAYAIDPTRQDSSPIWAQPNGSGGLVGGEYDDIDADIEGAVGASIAFTSQPSPGIVLGTITDNGGTADIVFMINKINGKYFIYGVSAGTVIGEGYNFIIIER